MNLLKKILIIDDDETTCFLNKIFLEDMQVTEEVECLYDAREAIELIKNLYSNDVFTESGPDLIFLDINMPIMNGFEFLEKLKQLDGMASLSSQRVVMFTSSTNPKDIERANNQGVLAYLQKPLTKPKLKLLIEAYHKQDF